MLHGLFGIARIAIAATMAITGIRRNAVVIAKIAISAITVAMATITKHIQPLQLPQKLRQPQRSRQPHLLQRS